MIETDTRGIEALSGGDPDIVLDWFEELKEQFGVDPDAGWPEDIDTSFQEWPPPAESVPLEVLLGEIVGSLYVHHGSHQVMESQRALVDAMYRLTKEAQDAEQRDGNERGSAQATTTDGVVDAGGGGGVVSGGSEDGVAVGQAGQAAQQKNRRRAPKVPGGGRVAAAGAAQ